MRYIQSILFNVTFYAANLVIYSSTEPAVVGGKIWLKPIS